jgi:hypothetical protein
MFCDEVLEIIEPIAAGERRLEGRIQAHLDTCRGCTEALDRARQVDRLLHARPAPKPPANFAARTLALVRRQRWRSEQYVDAGFNLSLAILAVLIVGSVWFVLNRSGLVTVGADVFDLFGAAFRAVAGRIAPSLPVYAGATALLVMALGVWWWAERGSTT